MDFMLSPLIGQTDVSGCFRYLLVSFHDVSFKLSTVCQPNWFCGTCPLLIVHTEAQLLNPLFESGPNPRYVPTVLSSKLSLRWSPSDCCPKWSPRQISTNHRPRWSCSQCVSNVWGLHRVKFPVGFQLNYNDIKCTWVITEHCMNSMGPVKQLDFTEGIWAWISNHSHCFMWDVITHPCSNFNST